jgi:microcystin degradation protein MlrC
VSVIVVAERDGALAREQAEHLATAVWAQRDAFGPETPTLTVDAAISAALAAPDPGIFLSDAGDNVTAGGVGDNAYVLERLLAAHVPDAVVAGLADAPAVAACARVGLGGAVTTSLGGSLDPQRSSSVTVTGTVVHLDPADRPTLAVLRVAGVEIVVTADRRSFTTRASFLPSGIDPARRKIVVVKLGYLFPELREIASQAFMLLSPGCTDLRLTALPFQRLRRPIAPLDAVGNWQP